MVKGSWWINDWGDPVSRRARQLNRDVAETPLDSDKKVVNVASSYGAADQVGALFRHSRRSCARGKSQKYLRGMVVGNRIGKRRELCRVRGLFWRTCVIGSISKTVSSAAQSFGTGECNWVPP